MLSAVYVWVLFITLCLNSAHSYSKCAVNEVEVDCVNLCNNCEQKGKCTGLSPPCQPGCDCEKGYFRDERGRCIREQQCKSNDNYDPYPECPSNEIKVRCVNPCNTCGNRGNCIRVRRCQPGCDCARGFFRDRTGRCIPEQQCKTKKCVKNAIFLECGLKCEPTCEEPFPDYCNEECVAGCFCIPGFLRNEDGKCVPPEQCDYPQIGDECDEDEQYYQKCTPSCRNTCENYNNSQVKCECDPPGCFCAEGLVKRSDGVCVAPGECPGKCLPDEEYYDYIPNCKNTCENFNNPGIRCPPGPPGCFCKEGLVKNNEGRCVHPKECPVTERCRPDEQYYDYIPDCKNTCENYNNPGVKCSRGPPGCFCKVGLVKRKDGKCVQPQDCQEEPPPQCPENAIFLKCGPVCPPTCEDKYPDPCEERCISACYCKPGYLKKDEGCVPKDECDKIDPPEECPPDEQYYKYIPNCKNTCEHYNDPEIRCRPGPPGCFCKEGLVKRKDGKCVYPRKCPGKCPKDEQYYEYVPNCKNTCENYNNPEIRCRPGPPGCFCKEGLVKRKDGKCVYPRKCPGKCPKDEQYYEYVPNCKNTCENYNNPEIRCRPGPPGCFCKEGLVRRKDGKCVYPRKCPDKCPPDEQYYEHVPSCKNTCEHYNNPEIRCRPGPQGCFCKEGLVKRKDGKCVQPRECPDKCPPDEQYYDRVPSCKNTCEHYNNPEIRCRSGPPGCFCKEGLVKRKDGKCVSPRECPGKCPPDEQYYECIPSCKNTCENYNNPKIRWRPGPPGCFCKEGLVKRKDGKCVNPLECPGNCSSYEQYYKNMPNCKNTCENYDKPGVDCPRGPPGCFCKNGLVKRKDGKCVQPRRCVDHCRPFEQYYERVPNCKNTCENFYNPEVKCPLGPPGCFCRKGLLKRKDGRCVLPRRCNEFILKCPEHAAFERCGPACQATCKDPYPGPCGKPCFPRCVCISGYLQNEIGHCVRPEQCKTGCRAPGEEFLECGSPCPLSCDYKKRPKNLDSCKKCVRGCFCKSGLLKTREGACVRPEHCPK